MLERIQFGVYLAAGTRMSQRMQTIEFASKGLIVVGTGGLSNPLSGIETAMEAGFRYAVVNMQSGTTGSGLSGREVVLELRKVGEIVIASFSEDLVGINGVNVHVRRTKDVRSIRTLVEKVFTADPNKVISDVLNDERL